MHKKLIEQNYSLLPSESIPNCCISCCYSEQIEKKTKFVLICMIIPTDARVCNFGICDKYHRRKELI